MASNVALSFINISVKISLDVATSAIKISAIQLSCSSDPEVSGSNHSGIKFLSRKKMRQWREMSGFD